MSDEPAEGYYWCKCANPNWSVFNEDIVVEVDSNGWLLITGSDETHDLRDFNPVAEWIKIEPPT